MFSFSTDGESFRGRFETEQEAVKKAAFGIANGVFWVGRCRAPIQPERWWYAADWLEHVSIQDDYAGDWADDWDSSTEEQREELETAVRKLMTDWLDKYGLRPKHWCIDDTQQYRVTEGVVELVGNPEPPEQ